MDKLVIMPNSMYGDIVHYAREGVECEWIQALKWQGDAANRPDVRVIDYDPLESHGETLGDGFVFTHEGLVMSYKRWRGVVNYICTGVESDWIKGLKMDEPEPDAEKRREEDKLMRRIFGKKWVTH